MVFCYTQRLVPYSAIIIAASSCSRQEQRQRPTARHYTERERLRERERLTDLGTDSSKGYISISSLPSDLRIPKGRGGRKTGGDRRDRGQQENKAL